MLLSLNENVALIDQIMFANIEILSINNIQFLIEKNILEITTSPIQYNLSNGTSFSRLNIEGDFLIDKMIAGVMRKGNTVIKYCNLVLSINSNTFGNLYCYTVDQYKKRLYKVQKHLLIEYGILSDFNNITIKEIEINRTFILNEAYSKYRRVITLIMHNLPKELKYQMTYLKNEKSQFEYESYYATSKKTKKSNRYLELKIYDKTKAITNKIILSASYMRIEFRFVGTQRIERALSTKYFSFLTDEIINNSFDKYIQRYIIRPFNSWKPERDKYLLKLIYQEREKDVRHWQINLIRILTNEEVAKGFPILLDVEELFPLLNNMHLTSKRKYEIKRNFQNIAQKYTTAYCQKDHIKLNEILQKIQLH